MTGDPMVWVAVVAGAAVGAPLRYLIEVGVTLRLRHTRWHMFPWGLLVVNVLGSGIAGLVLARTSGDLRILLLTGFCGALTTFSGFAWQTHALGSHRLRSLARPLWWWSLLGITSACLGAFWLVWLLASA